MSSLARKVALFSVLALASFAVRAGEGAQGGTPEDYPYEVAATDHYKNLTVFLLSGTGTFVNVKLMTLEEAMEAGVAVVNETGRVSQLTIENNSKDRTIFIQAGDIVKGGRQDRTIGEDLLIPPGCGQIPMRSFCVEQGRWRQRGSEVASQFSSSKNVLSSKAQKYAAKRRKNQHAVWSAVAAQQSDIAANVGRSVQADASPSSLQLTLEHEGLKELLDGYLKHFAETPTDKPDIVGCAIAINGEFSNAEVYGANELFIKFWPKILHAAAVEAIAELRQDSDFPKADAGAVKAAFLAAQAGTLKEEQSGEKVVSRTRESDSYVLFDTLLPASDALIHRNWMSKPEGVDAGEQRQVMPQSNQEQQMQIERPG